MANHTQVGSVTVDAFQWTGGTIAGTVMPVWAKQLALHTPGDGSLHIPTGTKWGTIKADAGDWVVRVSSGHIEAMSAATFATLYA